jgi:hypothetical protein
VIRRIPIVLQGVGDSQQYVLPWEPVSFSLTRSACRAVRCHS